MSRAPSHTITGNVVRDPEAKFTAQGTSFARFSVASNRSYQQGGVWKEETSFFDVVAWNGLSEHIVSSITKGMRVIVHGEFKQSTWKDEDDNPRSRVEFVASDVGPSLLWSVADVTKLDTSAGNATPPVAEPVSA